MLNYQEKDETVPNVRFYRALTVMAASVFWRKPLARRHIRACGPSAAGRRRR